MLTRSEKNKKEINKVERSKKIKKGFKIFKIVFLLILMVICFLLYSRYISTYGFEVREYSKVYDNLPKEYHGLKIVQISDIYYGNTTFKKELKTLKNEINKLKPDILVFTGDLVSSGYNLSDNEKEYIINTFNDIFTSIGKFSVLGDLDNEESINILKKSNFNILNNTSELIYKDTTTPLYINGISSTIKDEAHIVSAFENNNKNIFTITLMHETNSIDEILNNYNTDIIMAGHSRNGQIRLPLIGGLLKSKNSNKYNDFYYHKENTDIYISGGIGTKTIPFRLFNRPSINLYRLRSK